MTERGGGRVRAEFGERAVEHRRREHPAVRCDRAIPRRIDIGRVVTATTGDGDGAIEAGGRHPPAAYAAGALPDRSPGTPEV